MARDNNRLFTIIISCLLLVSLKVQGQELTFISPLVEEGVRQHLNLAEEEQISFLQLDTITTLDLSRRGITDIRDLVLMPKLRTLDLSDNHVEDLHPITVLDSLEWLDLRYNSLKGINELYYSTSKNMTINVSFNYIEDFSLFAYFSSCNFTLMGTGLQYSENPIYFEVNSFYADINDDGQPIINYRGYTNLTKDTYLKYGSSSVLVQLDGNIYEVAITDNLAETTSVTISNGELSEETYVVPTADYRVEAGETITMETGLPDDYYFSYAFAKVGTIKVVDNTLQYTAPDIASPDIIYFSYYKDYSLKGFSRFYINRDMKGDANGDGEFDLVDVVAMINNILGKPSSRFIPEAADMNDNGEVDIFDVMKAINLVLNNKTTATSKTRATKDTEEKAIVTATSDGILLGINDPARFTAFQFDVEVADGVELTDARLTANTDNHTLRFVKNDQNSYRVVGVSMNNSPLSANGNGLVELSFSKGGRVHINNLFFITPQESKVHFASSEVVVTGIDCIEDEQETEEIFDLSGRKVDAERKSLTKGIYIIGNKKIVIK